MLAALLAAAATTVLAPCPATANARALPVWHDVTMRADVDGDGTSDRVSIRSSPRARASCGFVLLVESRTRSFATTLPYAYGNTAIANWSMEDPTLLALLAVPQRGALIAIRRDHGASHEFVSLFGIVGGRLRLLTFPGESYASALDIYGSVGTGSTTVRCGRGLPLMLMHGYPTTRSGRRWRVDRVNARLVGTRFVVRRIRSVVVPYDEVEALGRRWGFSGRMFDGCLLAGRA